MKHLQVASCGICGTEISNEQTIWNDIFDCSHIEVFDGLLQLTVPFRKALTQFKHLKTKFPHSVDIESCTLDRTKISKTVRQQNFIRQKVGVKKLGYNLNKTISRTCVANLWPC